MPSRAAKRCEGSAPRWLLFLRRSSLLPNGEDMREANCGEKHRERRNEDESKLWFPYRVHRRAPRFRIFCFPFAGGSAGLFGSWATTLPEDVEVCSVQLPGRGTRIREPLFTRLDSVIDALIPVVRKLLDLPFVLFGHSLGALVAFEVARRLRRDRLAMPERLFASAFRGPSLPVPTPHIHALEDGKFANHLRELNGTPAEILANSEMLEILLPMLRADFAIAETYRYYAELPLPCGISAWAGSQDAHVGLKDLEAWGRETEVSFERSSFPGDHFFVFSQQKLLLDRLMATMSWR